MTIHFDRKTFFTYVRRAPFGNRLTQQQVDGISTILDYYESMPSPPPLEGLAYTFSTIAWETGMRMVPVRETFAKSDEQAYNRLNNAWKNGRIGHVTVSNRYWRKINGISYFGRGRVQNTHKENYEKLRDRFGHDFVNKPNLLLDNDIDAEVTVVGHVEGIWTGHDLARYFGEGKEDPVGARRIINGQDKARHIASNLYPQFLAALEAAREDTPLPTDVSDDEAKPDGKGLLDSTTNLAAAASGAAGTLGTLLAALSNPYALAGLVVIVLATAWIVRERMRHAREDGV